MSAHPNALLAAATRAKTSASSPTSGASTDTLEVITDELHAIAAAAVAATELDPSPWAVAEAEERQNEAANLVTELKIQLKSELQSTTSPDCG